MAAVKRSAMVLGAIAVFVLPGGSLVLGAVWLYRWVAASRAAA